MLSSRSGPADWGAAGSGCQSKTRRTTSSPSSSRASRRVRTCSGANSGIAGAPRLPYQQARQRPVAEIEDDPRAAVLEHEAAAGAARLGPGAAAAEHHQAAGRVIAHGTTVTGH